MLRVGEMLIQDGQAAAVPLILKQLAAKDEAGALLLTAKAYEQTGDPTRASANLPAHLFLCAGVGRECRGRDRDGASWIKHGGS